MGQRIRRGLCCLVATGGAQQELRPKAAALGGTARGESAAGLWSAAGDAGDPAIEFVPGRFGAVDVGKNVQVRPAVSLCHHE